MTPDRRAQIVAHAAAIAARPWPRETASDQRAEMAAFIAALRRRGEYVDAGVMVALNAAERQIA